MMLSQADLFRLRTAIAMARLDEDQPEELRELERLAALLDRASALELVERLAD